MGDGRPTVIDLFSGCGGFSLGAELAGFHVTAAVDIDPTLQSAHRMNFRKTKSIEASVTDLDADAWSHLVGNQRPTGLIGGPPCQGFSRIGRRQADDPRNTLLGDFYRQILLLKPIFFVMENVPGLLDDLNRPTLEAAIETVASLYDVSAPTIINARDFGAATNRRRVVVFGTLRESGIKLSAEIILAPTKKMATVKDAISDLPNPLGDEESKGDWGWSKIASQANISAYAKRLRRAPPDALGSSDAKARHAKKEISGLAGTKHSKEIARRYAALSPGASDPICKSMKLDWDGQSPTLRAGTGPDKGAFQAVRPLHPAEGRVITVREAARLQSFPDWFLFHATKWHSFRMIGNSVPPLVSEGILSRIKAALPEGAYA